MRIERCKTREGYKVTPEEKLVFDLQKLKRNPAIVLYCWTPFVAACKYKGVDVIIHRYGELQFKMENDITRVRDLSGEIYTVLCCL